MKKRLIILLALLFCAYTAYVFNDFIEDIHSVCSTDDMAEAVVVLTGGKGRVEAGLDLLEKGRGNSLIITGVHEDSSLDAIFTNKIAKHLRGRIILEKKAKSTYENAIEVRRILDSTNRRSMILITSGYHMVRARYIFSRVMPKGIKVSTYAVATSNFDEERWWDGKGLGLVVLEFVKYRWYRFWFAVGYY